MLEAALEAQAFVQGRARSDLDGDRMLLLAVVKSLEIVGEASSKVSPEAQHAVPSIPWRNIVGMRNRLIHGYFDIDRDIVWRTVIDELPPLIDALREALS